MGSAMKDKMPLLLAAIAGFDLNTYLNTGNLLPGVMCLVLTVYLLFIRDRIPS